MDKKHLKYYKETPEQRHERVVAEGNRFRARTVPMKGKNQYSRNSRREKNNMPHARDY
jgi:hypothetical protein